LTVSDEVSGMKPSLLVTPFIWAKRVAFHSLVPIMKSSLLQTKKNEPLNALHSLTNK
jgi:hypothetical protein